MSWLKKLEESAGKASRNAVGLMSGTSVDSIDVAFCEIKGGGPLQPGREGAEITLQHFYSHPYDSVLQRRVRNAAGASTRDVAELHAAIGDAFAAALAAGMKTAGISRDTIDIVGSHGQTVYHHSRRSGAERVTLQLGDGDRIAAKTGLPVFCDFRARDIAEGGEGAPLTPYADAVLFSIGKTDKAKRRAILNLGGIANITILDADISHVIGFDTGPANAPLDRLVRKLTQGKKEHDEDGNFASQGKINEALLKKLLDEDTFIKKLPPKSTGFEMYGDEYVEKLISMHGRLDNDLIRTVTEFVARSIVIGVTEIPKLHPPVDEVVLAGGGAKNKYLRSRLEALLAPIVVCTSDDRGVPSQAREGIAFALFANDALLGLRTSLPSVTGASRAVTLGKLCLPS